MFCGGLFDVFEGGPSQGWKALSLLFSFLLTFNKKYVNLDVIFIKSKPEDGKDMSNVLNFHHIPSKEAELHFSSLLDPHSRGVWDKV